MYLSYVITMALSSVLCKATQEEHSRHVDASTLHRRMTSGGSAGASPRSDVGDSTSPIRLSDSGRSRPQQRARAPKYDLY